MHYIDCVLTDADRHSLQEAGIEFCEHRFGTDACHRVGISFSQIVTERVLDILGLVKDPNKDISRVMNPATGDCADYDLSMLPLRQPPTSSNPVAVCLQAARESQVRLEQAIKPFVEEAGLLVTLLGRPYGDARYVQRTGHLRIYANSVPVGTRDEPVRRSFAGLSTFLRVIGSTRSYFVVRDTRGHYIALFQGDAEGGTLWLLFEPTRAMRASEPVSYVLYALARHLHPELGEIGTWEQYQSQASMRQFMVTVSERIEREVQNLPAQANEAQLMVTQRQRLLVEALRTEQHVRESRALSEANPDAYVQQVRAKLRREADLLLASREFESISFEQGDLWALTRPIDIEHEGRFYQFGRYRIRCRDQDILIQSEDGVDLKGHPHPHVSGSSPCFGNTRETIMNMLAAREYGQLLPFIVLYLQTGYYPGDAYEKIEDFHRPSYLVGQEAPSEPARPAVPRAPERPLRGRPRRTRVST